MPDPKRVKLYYSDPVEPDNVDDSEEEGEEEEESAAIEKSKEIVEISDGSENEDDNEDEDGDEEENDDDDDNDDEPILSDYDNYKEALSIRPNPGLIVHNVGLIRLPVSDENAEKLASQASAESIAKTGVADIVPAEFEFVNTAWTRWIDEVVTKAAVVMGVQERMNLKARLHGLRVYRTDDKVKNPRSENNTDSIGILEISLPGQFEGGNVALAHKNEKTEVNFGNSALMFDTVATAWFSDVTRKTTKLSKGYKVTLVYDLVINTNRLVFFKPSAATCSIPSEFIKALQAVKRTDTPIVYVLKGDYLATAQYINDLTGLDKLVVQNLIQAVEKVGGTALYCGDLLVKDTKHRGLEEYDEYSDDDDDPEEFDEFDFADMHVSLARDPNLPWKKIQKAINTAGSPTDSEKDSYTRAKAEVIIRGCLTKNAGFTDSDIKEAGAELGKTLKPLVGVMSEISKE
ncbi:hypothetical protein ABW20_dc0103327 [Dactylellina cionopaga]|nr:hypothetical protein ABW20_dc0103327 [Dactylellina cionopaga]